MSFSMSGGPFSYNRFDDLEKALKESKGYQEGGEVKGCKDDCDCDDCGKKRSSKKKSKKSSGAKPDFLDLDNDGDKEEDMADAVSEGIDFKGAKRIDDAREAAQKKKDEKNPSGKQRRLALGKFRPGASAEERADGGRDSMREKGTSPIKNGKKMFEDAYAAVYGEGFVPMNKEKQAKIDRQIGRSADKEAIESGKRDRDRDDKKVDREYQRQIAMKFQKKMKKEDFGYSDVYTSAEEGEQLDELNKSTLGSYVKKASKDLGDRRFDQGESEKRQYEPDAEDEKEDKKLANREAGIAKAVGKMLKKEELEIFSSEELAAIEEMLGKE